MVGAALNFDALDEPEVEYNGRLTVIFEFLEFLEGPIRYGDIIAYNLIIFTCSLICTGEIIYPKAKAVYYTVL